MEVEAGKMRAHFQDDERYRECRADPEAACHIDQFFIRSGFGCGAYRFERHAADRAGARAHLPDLRVHRTGIDRARRRGRCGLGFAQILCWIGDELAAAAARAEEILVALVRVPMRRLRRIDRHPAYGIGNGAFADRAKGST
jgi:hypothetical protein